MRRARRINYLHADARCMTCNFPTGSRGEKCDRCGFKLWRDFNKPPRRNCPTVCAHLGPATTTVKVECHTCQGQKLVDQPAHQCEVYRRCLPTYRPTGEALEQWHARKPECELYQLCSGCPSFAAAATSPASAPAAPAQPAREDRKSVV